MLGNGRVGSRVHQTPGVQEQGMDGRAPPHLQLLCYQSLDVLSQDVRQPDLHCQGGCSCCPLRVVTRAGDNRGKAS